MAKRLKPVSLLPFELYNIEDFLTQEHPVYMPDTPAFDEYWDKQLEWNIQGKWGHDYDLKRDLGGFRYMPKNQHFYINTCQIKVQGKRGQEIEAPPSLRDIEWFMGYDVATCDGFAGFAEGKFTGLRPVQKLQLNMELSETELYMIEQYGEVIRDKYGKIKPYKGPLEILYETYDEPQGNPLYLNERLNQLLLSTRGVGKDLWEESLIYTPEGPKKIKDAEVGDRIFGGDGKLTTIVDVTRYYDQEQFTMRLVDGRKATCGAGHLWTARVDGEEVTIPMGVILQNPDAYEIPTTGTGHDRLFTLISDIRSVGVKPSVCIGVDNQDKLFLTDDDIITHNSFGAINMLALYGFILNGAQTVEEYFSKKTSVTTVVGSYESKKSEELLSKMEISHNYIKNKVGAYEYGPGDHENGVFWHPYSGSTALGSTLRKSVKNKSGMGTEGVDNKIPHVTWKTDASAAVGHRANVLVEECFAPGTLVRMADNSLKAVENIQAGDKVLQPGGGSATVGKTCSGTDTMYRVEQKYGIDYTVNSKHKLVLDYQGNLKGREHLDGVYHVAAEDFTPENLGKYRYRTSYGVASEPIDFEAKEELPVHPYYLGSYLGDGSKRTTAIVFNKDKDKEAAAWFVEYAESLGLEVNITPQERAPHVEVYYARAYANGETPRKNILREKLKEAGVWRYKFIPPMYLRASREDRLQLLAGLIDTDGNVNRSPSGSNFAHEIHVSKRLGLATDILRLAKSLGFRATLSTRLSTRGYGTKKVPKHFRFTVRIRGNNEIIPVKLPYKQAPKKEWASQWSRTPVKVKEVGRGEYFGFTLEGDNPLFLLEDYTVVHNCGLLKSAFAVHGENSAVQGRDFRTYWTWYIGTGGDVTAIKPMSTMFWNPTAFNILSHEDKFTGTSKKIASFIPAYLRKAIFKDDMGNSDVERGFRDEMYERDKRKDRSEAYARYCISYPILPREMFQQVESGYFPLQLVEDGIDALDNNPPRRHIGFYMPNAAGQPIWNEDVDGRLQPIDDLGVEDNLDSKKGAVVIYEHPVTPRPARTLQNPLYIVFYDQVMKKGQKGPSLAVAFVFKTWDLMDMRRVQFNIVAEWVGRMDTTDANHQVVMDLAAAYDAYVFPETNLEDFERYATQINKYHWLHPMPGEIVDGIVKKGQAYEIGLKIVPGMIPTLRTYLSEVLSTVTRVQEQMNGMEYERKEFRMAQEMRSRRALTEIQAYNEDDNFDYVSAMLLLGAWAKATVLKPEYVKGADRVDAAEKQYREEVLMKRRVNTTHSQTNSAFSY